MMTYTETNSKMPTLEPTTYCDIMHSSSSDVPTFVAMLDDAYDMNLHSKITEDVCNRLEQLSESENHRAMSPVSDDEEPMNVCDIPVKLERPQYLTIPLTNFPANNTNFLRQERKGDVLLSDHKPLPDINFFIKTPKKNTVFSDGRKRSFEMFVMDFDHPSHSADATNVDEDSSNFVNLDVRRSSENRIIKPKLKVEQRPMEIPMNTCSLHNIPDQKISKDQNITNCQYFVKCENHRDNYASLVSSLGVVPDTHTQAVPIIEHHAPEKNCGFPHSTGSDFGLPQQYRPDNSVFHENTYMRSSPNYLSPIDIVEQNGHFNLNRQNTSDSSYSTSPCSISSSTSSIESNVSHPTSGATVNTRKDFEETPILRYEDADNDTKTAYVLGESNGHFEHGTSVGSYMEEILNEVIKNVEVACMQLQLPAGISNKIIFRRTCVSRGINSKQPLGNLLTKRTVSFYRSDYL